MVSSIFYLSDYKEGDLTLDTVKSLKSLYNPFIFVRSDGVYNDKIAQISNIKYMTDARRKTYNSGGLLTHRYLTLCLSLNPDLIIKIDPDTFPQKTLNIKNLPNDKITCNKTYKNIIKGGFIGYPKKIAEKIINSELLLDSKFKNEKYNYLCRSINENISSQDLILSEVIQTLGIPTEQSNEIKIEGKYVNLTHFHSVSFLHPVRSLEYRKKFRKAHNIELL